MNGHATRLLLLNGKPAYRRLGAIVAGVALGTGMLLILLGAFMQLPQRDARVAWMDTEVVFYDEGDETAALEPSADQMLITSRVDNYGQDILTVVSIATTVDTQVRMPDGSLPPRAGEYYASEAAAELIAAAPADELEQRYGTQGGEIGHDMVKGPSQAVVVTGVAWELLADHPDAVAQTDFWETTRYDTSATYRVILAMGAIALLVPILLLVSIVSQLGAAERRERLATVRLIGAGRKAVAAMSGAEMLYAGLAGAVLGVLVALGLRPLAAQLFINGSTSFPADLMPSVGLVIAVVIAVGLMTGFAAWWRAYRDDVGALGSARERQEKPVTAWRTVILGLGLIGVLGSSAIAVLAPSMAEAVSYSMLLGFGAMAVGVVIAGPWLTKVTARLIRSRTGGAATVVAASRLERHPRATFRSVGGLVIAVFVVSVFAGAASAILGVGNAAEEEGALPLNTLYADIAPGQATPEVVGTLEAVDGVTDVVFAYGSGNAHDEAQHMTPEDARVIGAVGVPDAPGVSIDLYGMLAGNIENSSFAEPTAVDVEPSGEPEIVLVVTDGKPSSIERARTAVLTQAQPIWPPVTRADFVTRATMDIEHELAVMAYLGMGIAIGISALSLTVATVAAALDRRRTFGLLRLSGMPMAQLRRTVALEATLPLVSTLVISAGLGFVVAWSLLSAMSSGLSMGWPAPMYWAAIGVSLLLTVGAVLASFGTVRRSTEVASTRFE